MTAQLDLFASSSAALRARAWARCVRLNVSAPADPVTAALAVEAMATARQAYDLAEGLDPDGTGLVFAGEAPGHPLLLPPPPPRPTRGTTTGA